MSDFDIRAAARDQFKNERGGLKKVYVPEWGEEAIVYYYPKLTIGDWEILSPYIATGFKGFNMISAVLYSFVLGARDEAGKRLYSMAAIDEIRSGQIALDIDVIARIVGEMGYLKPDDEELLAKKSLKNEANAEKSQEE